MHSLPTFEAICPRSPDQILTAARVIQANVTALRVAWCKRTGQSAEGHDIKTPPPGTIREMRELLIDRNSIKEYDLQHVSLRLRQSWGQFCALCWIFPGIDPQHPEALTDKPDQLSSRCPMHVQEKLAEVQQGLWRLLHEQRLRFDPDAKMDPEFQRVHQEAIAHPITVFKRPIAECSDEELLCCTCEFAGMLGALRWAMDSRWKWEAPGIMDLQLRT